MRKRFKIANYVAILLCAFTLVGCSDKEQDHTVDENASTDNYDANTQKGTFDIDNQDANYMYNAADAQGSVVELMEDGCVITPIIATDGGQKKASSGYDDETLNITIQYQEDCVFKIAKINQSTQQVSYSTTSKFDIKKQTNLVLYGEYQDSHTFLATHVLITRYK